MRAKQRTKNYPSETEEKERKVGTVKGNKETARDRREGIPNLPSFFSSFLVIAIVFRPFRRFSGGTVR